MQGEDATTTTAQRFKLCDSEASALRLNHCYQDAGAGSYIRWLSKHLTNLDRFGRHEVECAELIVFRDVRLVPIHPRSDAEIDQLQGPSHDQEVRGLQVEMDDSLLKKIRGDVC